MNDLDLKLHVQPLMEREHTFLQYIQTKFNQLLFYDARLIQNPKTSLETMQPKHKKQQNKLRCTHIDPMKLEDEMKHNIVMSVINFSKINLSKVYILGIADYLLEMSMEETQFEQP